VVPISLEFSTQNKQHITMEKARAAVGSFLSRDGKHDTTVHEVSSLHSWK
jgi:hypothetical protein